MAGKDEGEKKLPTHNYENFDLFPTRGGAAPAKTEEQKLKEYLAENFNAVLNFIQNDSTPEQRLEITKALGLTGTHTDKFNIAKEFICNGITPEETRELKLTLRDKIKEFDQNPETAIPNIRLDIIRQEGRKDRFVEHSKTKFSSTNRTLSEDEIAKLNPSKYDSVGQTVLEHPSVRPHLDANLK